LGEPSPLDVTSRVIGRRWAIPVIYALHSGPKRFTELLAAVKGITPRALSHTLKALVEHGVVVKTPHGRGAKYALSEMGAELSECLHAFKAWAEKYRDKLLKSLR
jgi:DNA-binding HxlR family transcriptional regulator